MGVQDRRNNTNFPFIRSGVSVVKDGQTLLTDAGRTTPLAPYTVMARVSASRKWVPLTDVTAAATGENVARGIYMGDSITAAAIVAGDVTGLNILVGGCCTVDAGQLVFENSLALTTAVSDDPAGADNGVVHSRIIEDDLARVGIFAESTENIDILET